VPLDLGQNLPLQSVPLASKVPLRGTVTGAPASTTVLVLDDVPEIGRAFAPVALTSTGVFAVAVDPYRAYHLVVDPPVGGSASRVPLGGVQTAAAPFVQPTQAFPNMLSVSGQVTPYGSFTGVPNALVQIFCLGPGPDCLDRSQLSSKDPLPLIETVTDAAGGFALWVPDPAPSP
jgi:hypothetical protein